MAKPTENKPPEKSAGQSRKERLKTALKANMSKRKAQLRARQAGRDNKE